MSTSTLNDLDEMEGLSFLDASLELTTKPGVSLHYTFNPATDRQPGQTEYLLVCINGLGLPQAGWFPVLYELKKHCKIRGIAFPSTLTYDRWSQGRTTDQDPLDSRPDREPGYGHDAMDIVHDLHQFLLQMAQFKNTDDLPPMVFLAHSVGCPISRLYAQTYPGTIHAFIFLDSMMANQDMVSFWPDPESPSFDAAESLPEGTTVDQLRKVRESYKKLFHPTMKNPENFDRRHLRDLLPHSDAPLLPVVHNTGQSPLLVIVTHDPQTFTQEGFERLGVPIELSSRYAHATMRKYSEGLVQLTRPDKARGPISAPRTGHFVQKDNPSFVAGVACEVLHALVTGQPLTNWNQKS